MVNTYNFACFVQLFSFSSSFYPSTSSNKSILCTFCMFIGSYTVIVLEMGVRVRRSKSSVGFCCFDFSLSLSLFLDWICVRVVCVCVCVLRNSSSRNETVQLWSIVSFSYSCCVKNNNRTHSRTSARTHVLFVIYAKYFLSVL